MPRKLYALTPNAPKDLEVAWKGGWKNLTISRNGQVIGQFDSAKDLRQGGHFQMEDGSTLFVQLKGNKLMLQLNGQPLPETADDPLTKYKSAYQILYLVGGLSLVVGVLSLFVEFLAAFGGPFSIAFGAIILGLAFLAQQRQKWALAAGIGLYALDTVLVILFAVAGGGGGIGGLVIRAFFLWYMFQGLSADIRPQSAPVYPNNPSNPWQQ